MLSNIDVSGFTAAPDPETTALHTEEGGGTGSGGEEAALMLGSEVKLVFLGMMAA